MSCLPTTKTHMSANISLPFVSLSSRQPRWLTLGERGLLGSASARVLLSGCSPSLCYHSSLPISILDCCSCDCFLPFLTLSTTKSGCTETLRANFSLKKRNSSSPSPLWIYAIFTHQLFTVSPPGHPLLCVTSWLPAPSGL